ncbi:MAG: hypothetical protein GXP08_00010 [Gammaproteobacteria bacterium]|nr:hypothetical protein [Gammaproteobacteria bacterium]
MKNDDRHELKPIYIQQTSFCEDDGISLVDLAMILVRRKKLIALIVAIFITLGFTTALLTPKTYQYSSVLEIGSQIISGKLQTLEPATNLIAKLDSSYIPQILYNYRLSNPADRGEYKIKTSSSGNTIITLGIKGSEKQGDLVKSFLRKASQKVISDHDDTYTSIKNSLVTLLDQIKHDLQKLKLSSNNEAEITAQYNTIKLLTAQLTSLHNTQVISPPMRSFEPTGSGRKLIAILSTFAGLFFAVLAAFFAEFISKVREKTLAENKDKK